MNCQLIFRDEDFARQGFCCFNWGCAHSKPSKTVAVSRLPFAQVSEVREPQTRATSPRILHRARTSRPSVHDERGCGAVHPVRCCRRRIGKPRLGRHPARLKSIPANSQTLTAESLSQLSRPASQPSQRRRTAPLAVVIPAQFVRSAQRAHSKLQKPPDAPAPESGTTAAATHAHRQERERTRRVA